MMHSGTDYRKFYDDETYLLEEAGPRFRLTGELPAADFWMILIWKANRAKTYHRTRLKKIANDSFPEAVGQIAVELYACMEHRERLRLLMETWGFEVPTATAILTILYPEWFTIFDYRVYDQLAYPDQKNLAGRCFSESLWSDYLVFRQAGIDQTPDGLPLRDKDRWLSGKSYREEVLIDCED